MATYAAQAVNGSGMATTNEFGLYSQANNKHGIMKSNGTATSNIVGSVKTVRPLVTTFASTPISSGVTVADYAAPANANGTFAHNHVQPISSFITKELAGLNNTALLSPGNDQNTLRGINKQETITTRKTTTAVRAGNFNIYTGKFTTPPSVSVDNWAPANTTTLSSTTTDSAAAASRSSPGKLTYLRGGLVPYRDSYKPKTN